MRIVKKYQQKRSDSAPLSWWEISAAYNNEKDSKDRNDGDDYSFANYAGDKRLGISSMSASPGIIGKSEFINSKSRL